MAENSKYWIVKLGKLYYSCGLSRVSQVYSDAVSFEMTTEEMVAWPFKHVEIAVGIAEEIGGVVIEKEGDIEVYVSHAERNLDYLGSEPKSEKRHAVTSKKRSRVNRNGMRLKNA